MDEPNDVSIYHRGDGDQFNPCDSFEYCGEYCNDFTRRVPMDCCGLSYCESCINHRNLLGQRCYCKRILPGVWNAHKSKLYLLINNGNYRNLFVI